MTRPATPCHALPQGAFRFSAPLALPIQPPPWLPTLDLLPVTLHARLRVGWACRCLGANCCFRLCIYMHVSRIHEHHNHHHRHRHCHQTHVVLSRISFL
jgi:hypothetical protein